MFKDTDGFPLDSGMKGNSAKASDLEGNLREGQQPDKTASGGTLGGMLPAFGNPARSKSKDLRRLCGPRSHEVCPCRFRCGFK